jgi:hypothetical protein
MYKCRKYAYLKCGITTKRCDTYQNFPADDTQERIVLVREAAVQDGDVEVLLAEDVDDVVGRRE